MMAVVQGIGGEGEGVFSGEEEVGALIVLQAEIMG
jgi:hypothetical protein